MPMPPVTTATLPCRSAVRKPLPSGPGHGQVVAWLQVRQQLGSLAADLVEEAERSGTDVMDADGP